MSVCGQVDDERGGLRVRETGLLLSGETECRTGRRPESALHTRSTGPGQRGESRDCREVCQALCYWRYFEPTTTMTGIAHKFFFTTAKPYDGLLQHDNVNAAGEV